MEEITDCGLNIPDMNQAILQRAARPFVDGRQSFEVAWTLAKSVLSAAAYLRLLANGRWRRGEKIKSKAMRETNTRNAEIYRCVWIGGEGGGDRQLYLLLCILQEVFLRIEFQSTSVLS